MVLVLFSVQSAFLAVNQPTRSAVLPRLLPADELPAANALNMTSCRPARSSDRCWPAC